MEKGENMRWMSFPKNVAPTQNFKNIVEAFKEVETKIASSPTKKMESNKVLEAVRPGLEKKQCCRDNR